MTAKLSSMITTLFPSSTWVVPRGYSHNPPGGKFWRLFNDRTGFSSDGRYQTAWETRPNTVLGLFDPRWWYENLIGRLYWKFEHSSRPRSTLSSSSSIAARIPQTPVGSRISKYGVCSTVILLISSSGPIPLADSRRSCIYVAGTIAVNRLIW